MRVTCTVLLAVLAGCASRPRDNTATVYTLIEEGMTRKAPELELKAEVVATEVPKSSGSYRLGAQDVLDIQVEGQPQFSVRSPNAQHHLLGFRVQDDGNVYLPLLGGVPARGLTVLDVQLDLKKRLEQFVDKPNVAVDVLTYDSQKFYVLGAVHKPGVFKVDGRATLLEGIGLAGGVMESGDIESAYVARAGTLLPVSIGDILLRGDTSRNIVMEHGDLIYLAPASKRQVYVLGDVVKPGIVPIPQGGLNLTAAIAAAGGLDLVHADKNQIRLFRGSWQCPRVYTIGACDVYRYGSHIPLEPGDCIHVAPTGLANWSRALTLLHPFVSNTLTAATLGVAISR